MIFKTIPTIDSRYLAGDDGDIYSDMGKSRRVLAGGANKDYLNVSVLTVEGNRVTKNVHWLVCSAFSGEMPEGQQAAHLDGDAENNLPSNLTWKTVKDNIADKKLHGTHDGGAANSRASLTEVQLKEIRVHLNEGELLHREIATLYGVTRTTITKINNGARYKE